jgi:hypothetical protein
VLETFERLSSEFEPEAFGESEGLSSHQIGFLKSRSAYGVPRTIADNKLRHRRESCRVEVFRHCLALEFVGIAESVWALNGEVGSIRF